MSLRCAFVALSIALASPAFGQAPSRLSVADEQKLVQALVGRPPRPMKVRLQAAIVLGRAGGPDSVPALIEALQDTEYAVRGAAVLALGNLGDLRAVEPLVATIDDLEEFVREEATKALGKVARKEAVPYLQAAGGRASPRVRLALAQVVANIPGAEAAGLLADFLGDDEAAVSEEATRLVQAMPADAAAQLLLRGLEHPSYRVRARCARLLGERKESRALDKLAEILVASAEAMEVQEAALKALRGLGDQLDARKLSEAVRDSTLSKEERGKKLRLLGARGGGDAMDTCLLELDDVDDYLRGMAAMALGDLGDPRPLSRLRDMLKQQENLRISKILSVAIHRLERGGATASVVP